MDNIDHHAGSTSAQGVFDGTGISLFQHKTEVNAGFDLRVVKEPPSALFVVAPNKSIVAELPSSYTHVSPLSTGHRHQREGDMIV